MLSLPPFHRLFLPLSHKPSLTFSYTLSLTLTALTTIFCSCFTHSHYHFFPLAAILSLPHSNLPLHYFLRIYPNFGLSLFSTYMLIVLFNFHPPTKKFTKTTANYHAIGKRVNVLIVAAWLSL
jgi:hypothetical protein